MSSKKMRVDGRIAIALSGIFYGGITVDASILARAGLSTLDISFFFLSISLVPLFPFVVKRSILRKIRLSFRFLMLYAAANTLSILAQFAALSLGLSPAIVAFLLYTQPVWTVLFGKAFFREKISQARILVVIVALVGIIVLTDPLSAISAFGPNTLLAELLAVLGGIFLSIWIILGKKGRSEKIKEPIELTFAVRSTTLIPIALISFGSILFQRGLFLANTGAIYSNLPLLIVFAVFAGIVPDSLFYWGVEKVQSLQAGVILLLEPISAAVMSAILLISSLTLLQILGGALILVSNYLALKESKTPPGTPDSQDSFTGSGQ